jgi:GNAT superfamily N-acetyltransferase
MWYKLLRKGVYFMIKLRQLKEKEWRQAMELKITCWTEELAGKAQNDSVFSEQVDFWINWMYAATDNADIRVTLGAFEGDELLGVVAGSIAEKSDIQEKGIECNGLWVYPKYRNKGISLKLLLYLLSYFQNFNIEQIVIYNHRYAPSNNFYRKFGVKELRQDYQISAGVSLLIDVFIIDIEQFKRELLETLTRYS